MKPDTWMPYYGSDFERDTKGWSRADRWSYFSALWAYWLTQGNGLIDDDAILRGVCECEKDEWPRVKSLIFGGLPFFYKEVNRWHQKRALVEINRSKSLYEKKMKQTLPARMARGLHVTDNVTSNASTPVTAPTGACTIVSLSSVPEKRGVGGKTEITERMAESWRVLAVKNGADYTAEEVKMAFLGCKATGWKWVPGDWMAGLERQIGWDRNNRAKNKVQGDPEEDLILTGKLDPVKRAAEIRIMEEQKLAEFQRESKRQFEIQKRQPRP